MSERRVPVIVNGARGKMGRPAVETLQAHPSFEVVAAIGRDDDLAAVIQRSKAEIVIDLTSADAVKENALTIIELGVHPVIGSSGLTEADVEELSQRCREKSLGGVIAPNFSLGAVLMMHFSKIAASLLPEVEIIEAHHPQKVDAPSGTAMKTAEMIANARQRAPKCYQGKQLLEGARGAMHHEVPIHSLRLPGMVADQTVVFGGSGEHLSIAHQTLDRQCFMQGIVFSCLQVLCLQHLVYGLESLLLKEVAL